MQYIKMINKKILKQSLMQHPNMYFECMKLDLEVMCSNPSRVKLWMHSTSA